MKRRRREDGLIVAWFAILAGAAFVLSLHTFLDQSRHALSAPPPEPINVSRLLIRPFLVRAGLAALLALSFVTARAAGVWPALKMYLLMLLAPAMLCAVLFAFGRPEWGPLVSGFLGLLLTGAAFIAVGVLIATLCTSSLAAALATFAVALVLATTPWLTAVLDGCAKGVIDARYLGGVAPVHRARTVSRAAVACPVTGWERRQVLRRHRLARSRAGRVDRGRDRDQPVSARTEPALGCDLDPRFSSLRRHVRRCVHLMRLSRSAFPRRQQRPRPFAIV